MTPSDDILDLLGRYATGTLSSEEQKRLFDAALDDQELFEQLVREQDLKLMLEEPGARLRMIRALEPPRRKTGWIFGVAATVALSVALVVVLLRPSPKPPEVAIARIPPPAPIVQPQNAPAETKPTPTPRREAAPIERQRDSRLAQSEPPPKTEAPQKEELAKDAVKKEAPQPQVAAAAPPPPATQTVEAAQQNGPRQQQARAAGAQQKAAQSRFATPTTINGLLDLKAPAFGFHYSTEVAGHLSIIPAIDGYLYVKSNDGTVLFGPKLSAAGIIVDLPLTDAVSSVVITFSENSDPVQSTPVVRSEQTGNMQGTSALAVEIKVK